jgi:hypothetical protein
MEQIMEEYGIALVLFLIGAAVVAGLVGIFLYL